MTTIFRRRRSGTFSVGGALDAYPIELALFKGEPQSEPSRLDEVIDALFDLDETQASTSAHRTRATVLDCEGRAA